ncbi:MAG: hypothetical protein WC822_05380 [Candidatus Paceibacterota bacterium]|jgi:hypothetical protein
MEYIAENKICQNCKKNFTIEPEDFNFYEKIKVPPPTFCPECRLIRRMMWRNERSLFRRANGVKGKSDSLISIYHPDAKIISYDKEMWWSDKWDSADYGIDYDFSRPFFEQFKELMERVPHVSFFDSKSVNARFCNVTVEMKNSYLVSATWTTEDSMYSNRLFRCKFTHDSYTCFNTEFGYENVYCRDSSRLFFSRESESCLDSYFLFDCRNCSNCILCTNLRNKNYCIENVQYTREEYFKKREDLFLDTRLGIEKAKIKFKELWGKAFHKHLKLINTNNVIGDQVADSRNCYAVFDFNDGAENVKYSSWGSKGLKDSYDVGPGCGDGSELTYEGISVGVHDGSILFGSVIWYSNKISYCYMMNNCHDCFGCAEMNGKQYCILNKQYTKQEYEKLVPMIINQMNEIPYIDKEGRIYKYGEFFPAEISPFSYNETIAQDYFPIDKEIAKSKGYKWREYTPASYQITIKGNDLPQTIKEVDDSILDQVIECEITKKPFKFLEQELSFYRRFDLPLPSIHPDERHNKRLKLRNPMVLRKRMCYFGDKEVFTTYLSKEEGGPEKVVCTEHYNQEIY